MNSKFLLLFPLLAVSLSASSILVTVRVVAPDDASEMDTGFRETLAAELAGYGFSATVKTDRIAEDSDASKRQIAATLNEARQAGASYSLLATLRNFNEEEKAFSGYGAGSLNKIFRCDFTYRLLRVSDGESLKGGSGTVSKTLRTTEGSTTTVARPNNDLIALAATRIAKEVDGTVSSEELESAPATIPVEVMIIPRGMGMTVPEIVETDSGQLLVTGERGDIVLDAVTVMVDGVVVGSAPGEIGVLPGLHELSLEREGFDTWTRTVNFVPGMDLTIRMNAKDEEIERFREQSVFLEGLVTSRTLTEAEAERIRGIAKMFEQSGFRWDIRSDAKSDIKVDTEEAITIEQNNRTLMGDNPAN